MKFVITAELGCSFSNKIPLSFLTCVRHYYCYTVCMYRQTEQSLRKRFLTTVQLIV
jgi:hypothetical protein